MKFTTESPFLTALLRGIYAGIVTGALTTLGTGQATGEWQAALVAGAITGLSVLATRTGIEGYVDTRRVTPDRE